MLFYLEICLAVIGNLANDIHSCYLYLMISDVDITLDSKLDSILVLKFSIFNYHLIHHHLKILLQ